MISSIIAFYHYMLQNIIKFNQPFRLRNFNVTMYVFFPFLTSFAATSTLWAGSCTTDSWTKGSGRSSVSDIWLVTFKCRYYPSLQALQNLFLKSALDKLSTLHKSVIKRFLIYDPSPFIATELPMKKCSNRKPFLNEGVRSNVNWRESRLIVPLSAINEIGLGSPVDYLSHCVSLPL